MCEYNIGQVSSILQIALLMDEYSIPSNIPSEETLEKRIDKASTMLLSAKLPEKQAKDLAKDLKAGYTKLLTTLEREKGEGLLYNTKYSMLDRVSGIAYILLENIKSPSSLEIEDSIGQATATLGVDTKNLDMMALTKQLNRNLEARYIDYGGF